MSIMKIINFLKEKACALASVPQSKAVENYPEPDSEEDPFCHLQFVKIVKLSDISSQTPPSIQ